MKCIVSSRTETDQKRGQKVIKASEWAALQPRHTALSKRAWCRRDPETYLYRWSTCFPGSNALDPIQWPPLPVNKIPLFLGQ